MILIYDSPRKICPVLMGAIEGAGARYGEQVHVVEQTCMKRGDPVCRFEIRFFACFLPSEVAPGGIVLLPDFAGNGAFEAIGNILETRQAAVVVPDYAAQMALCISGAACVVEPEDLRVEVAQRCPGAQRVIALAVQRIEVQKGDWSATLAYERARAALCWTNAHMASASALK